MSLNRREFLTTAAGVTASLAFTRSSTLLADSAAPGSFDFVFFTDTHIQPELDAAHGCGMCFAKISGIKSDFAIMGGDHVFDALAVSSARAKLVFDLYQRTEQSLQQKVYQTIGNHDLFGVLTKSGVAPGDPGYGKKLYEDRLGSKTYYSFDHKGCHFFVLDSIQPTPDRLWEARIDDVQLEWLAADLKQVRKSGPVIGVCHVPLVTAFGNYIETLRTDQKYNTLTVANSSQVVSLLENYNVVAVLQGHTHVNEVVGYKNTNYITSGAVCGNWWRGLRMGCPEGFTVVSLREGKISTRYETYGFKSVVPPEKS
jgi:UDP-2,3-diacylglucosamine pyrophosphatase LpxH